MGLRFKFTLLLVMIAVLLSGGCSNTDKTASYGASCMVYLEDLPEEYGLLKEVIRKNIEISVSLRNVSSNKTYRVKLSEKNGYREKVYLLPGKYDVSKPSISGSKLAMFDVTIESESIGAKINNEVELPVLMKDYSGFVQSMKNNQPKDEILLADIYSRKVQYNGQIIDLNSIEKAMKFTFPDNKSLKPAETFYVPSNDHTGVFLVVQNQTKSSVSSREATFTGVRFTYNNIVFPKGIVLGTDISEIVHIEKGLLGNPDYFKGTPLIGMGLDETAAVYIDETSGDRITFDIEPSFAYISAITYEFAKYE